MNRGAFPIFSRAELRRRFWHILPGSLPFLLPLVLNQAQVTIPARRILAVALTLLFVALLFYRSDGIRRVRETNLRTSILGYAIPVLAAFLLFPGRLEIGFTVLVLLAFGDGSATVAGLIMPRPSLPWNHRKSWAGFLSFLILGGLCVFVIVRQELAIAWQSAILVAFIIALPEALIESLPIKWNDNPRVGISTLILASAVYFFLV